MVSWSLLDEMYIANPPQNHGNLLGMAVFGLSPLYHILNYSQLLSEVFTQKYELMCIRSNISDAKGGAKKLAGPRQEASHHTVTLAASCEEDNVSHGFQISPHSGGPAPEWTVPSPHDLRNPYFTPFSALLRRKGLFLLVSKSVRP